MKKLPTLMQGPALRGGGDPRTKRIASYKIEAKLDDKRHSIDGHETLIWNNAGESAVTTLPFHLYLNAFKNEKSVFWQSSKGEHRDAKASDTGWGWITIESVQVGGVELVKNLKYPGPDETVVEVPLPKPVEPGSTIEVSFKFAAQLPEVFARTGYKGDFHLVGQWFPKIGVRVGPPGAEQWQCQPLHINTEFFADFGNYDVELTVPDTHVVAATGILVAARKSPGNVHTLTYHAEDVHDFVWMADPRMTITKDGFISGKAKLDDGGTVEVRVYAHKEHAAFAQRHLEAAIGAIEKFSHYFVPYPWPIMNVIDPPKDASEGAGGMEYPMFVTTGGDSVFVRPGVRLPEYVTVHEVGHNWFQGILASNEPDEAWLDEGVNEWADTQVMKDLYGPGMSIDWMGWQADMTALRAALRGDKVEPSPIATAAPQFVDNHAYSVRTYDGTMNAMLTLQGIYGSAKFFAAMKLFANTYAFKHPTGRDLWATLESQLGDLSWFIGPAFQQVGDNELSVRTAECRNVHKPRGVIDNKTITETEAPDTGTYRCEVVIQNTGIVHVPVEIELTFEDGSRQRFTWDDRGAGNWKRFELDRSSKLTAVRIDPDHKLALGNPIKYHKRIGREGAASMRAAARISSWAQTVMQLVGP